MKLKIIKNVKNINKNKFILITLCVLLMYSCNKSKKTIKLETIKQETIKEYTFELTRIGVDIYETYTSYEESKFSDTLTIMFLKFVFQIESEQNYDFKGLKLQKERDNVNSLLYLDNTNFPLRVVAIQYGNELITDFKTENLNDFRKKTKNLTSLDELFKWMLKLNFELEIAPDCSFEYKKPSSTKADFIFSDDYTIVYKYDAKSNKILKDVVSDTNKVISREYIDYD